MTTKKYIMNSINYRHHQRVSELKKLFEHEAAYIDSDIANQIEKRICTPEQFTGIRTGFSRALAVVQSAFPIAKEFFDWRENITQFPKSEAVLKKQGSQLQEQKLPLIDRCLNQLRAADVGQPGRALDKSLCR
jgi:hypothetical protein